MNDINLPENVKFILKTLNNNDHEAYVVGGAIRNALLDMPIKDYDITTSAQPNEIESIFKRTIPIGKSFGVITVLIDDETFEVATFRVDGEYSNSRHPDSVQFTGNLIEDLKRRDFTINTLCCNHEGRIIDLLGGVQDIKNKIIETVGDPDKRFQEDALRMVRAIRFQAQLDFSINTDTSKAIMRNSKLIEKISAERMQQELNKILMSNPLDLYALNYYGLLNFLIPELDICFWTNQDNPYHIYSVGMHITHSCYYVEPILHLRLAMLCHDISKPQCKTIDENKRGHFYGHPEVCSETACNILKRLRYDNITIMKVRDLVKMHNDDIPDTRKAVRRWLNKIGEEMLRDLLKVKVADAKAQNMEFSYKKIEKVERIRIILEEELEAQNCFSRKDLAINGNDLIDLGYKGKIIGKIINHLMDKVIDNPDLNNSWDLISITEKYEEDKNE